MSIGPLNEFPTLLSGLQHIYKQINYYKMMVQNQKRNVQRTHLNVQKGERKSIAFPLRIRFSGMDNYNL